VLASRWQNCLRDYIGSVNSGSRAIYLWEDQAMPAVCSVSRRGRPGWFLDNVKGPRNAEIDTQDLEIIFQSFAEASIPQASMIQTIEQLYEQDDLGF
jgi:hypothetical protein